MGLDEKQASGPVFRVTLSPGEDGYIVAECLNIPGCMSQGKTEKEALENIGDAIKACLEVIMEDALARVGAPSQEVEDAIRSQNYRTCRPQIEVIGLSA